MMVIVTRGGWLQKHKLSARTELYIHSSIGSYLPMLFGLDKEVATGILWKHRYVAILKYTFKNGNI